MKLYAHQKEIIDADPKKCGLFLGTGSAKSRTALELAQGKILAIVPKTQAEDQNWQRENKKWKINKKLTVISKETFRRDHEKLPAFDTVIIDEAHCCLGVTPNIRFRKRVPIPRTSQLFEAVDAYLTRTKPERIYLCTATIMRSPMTVWGAAKILGKKLDWYKFRAKYYVRLPIPFREIYTVRNNGICKVTLSNLVKSLGYVGRLEEYFDVPQQVWKTDHIELTQQQKNRIKELPLEFPDPIVLIGKKHQVENGVLAGDEFNKAEIFNNGKIDKILDYALEFSRMIIFVKYTAQIEQIATALRSAGKNVLTLTGATKDRGAVILSANKAKECVFVAQCQISAGWELPEYPVMIFASRNYEWVHFEQAKGRIQRANNIKKNLYIKLVVKNGVDDAIDFALENKEDFNEKLYATKKI